MRDLIALIAGPRPAICLTAQRNVADSEASMGGEGSATSFLAREAMTHRNGQGLA